MTNLVQHPDATYGLAAWTVADTDANSSTVPTKSVANTSWIRAATYNGPYTGGLTLTLTGETVPVSAGTVYTFSSDVNTYGTSTIPAKVWMSVRFVDDASVSKGTFTTPTTSWTSGAYQTKKVTGQLTVPAGATKCEITWNWTHKASNGNESNGYGVYFDLTNVYVGVYAGSGTGGSTPPPPTPPVPTGLDVTLEVQDTNANTNLITNASGDTGAAGWVSNVSSAVVTSTGTSPWTFLRMQAKQQAATWYVSDEFAVDTGLAYLGIRLLWGGFTADSRIGVSVEWLDVNQAVLGSTAEEVITPVANAEYNKVVGGYSTGTAYARLKLRQYHYTGSNDIPWVDDYFEFREATAIQSNVYAEVEALESWQAESIVWVDVIEPTHEISIERDSVDVGLLSATVLDEQYDPATGGLIKPGAAVRVSVNTGTTYKNIFQGTINNVRTEYPRKGSARISLSASDAMTLLSNQKEPKGVATIALLPNILADKGVKWSANGNANQVGSAAQVSSNDSASVFDQIVITRDSDKGYAWVDANNVLQLWNRSSMSTAPVVTFSDAAGSSASYSDIDTGFDTARTINVVEITYLRYYQNVDLEWVTDEIKYGPYINADSLKTWGAYKATFTIHGITESAANMQAFADEVLAKNATPTIKVNSIVVPVRNDAERDNAANIDLYSMVHVTYNTRFSGDLRVTGIKHEIVPDKWVTEYTFEKGDSVAVPVWTPSVNA